MDHETISKAALDWALSKVGCAYSQPKRTEKNIFDCSSLVARAYSAQGKKWKYGGNVPLSNQEVYDDDFELLWPQSYADIGKTLGGSSVIKLALKPGDLQFLCTDSDTPRANRITHVAMVVDAAKIVHARGKAYGVRTDAITTYRGKVCAVSRYNPSCALRNGMKGHRTVALQNALNAFGASLEADGEYGSATLSAVKAYQETIGISNTGIADADTLSKLGLLPVEESADGDASQELSEDLIQITGNTVNIRLGPGIDWPSIGIAHKDETYEAVVLEGWQPILLDGEIRWISKKYVEKCAGD